MKYIPSGVTRVVGQAILYGQKNEPTILFGVGIVGVVATAVLASKATLHLEETLEESQQHLDAVKNERNPAYTESKRRQDLAVIYTRSAIGVVKLYAPTIIVGGLAIAALTRSHKILTDRNAALATALNAVQAAFNKYRANVRDELGEDKDREFMYGAEERTIVEDTDKGPKKSTVKTYGKGRSPYSRVFDRENKNYVTTAEYNLQFLRGVQNYLNDLLNSRGHVMLNDAYDELGFDRTPAGTQVGWLRDNSDPNADGYIDFGIFKDKNMLQVHDFLTGREGALMIDFNVDGEIWSQINSLKVLRSFR